VRDEFRYNIALGQRRADAVKRMMTLVGAQDNQVETVSFGKEKPRNQGHDEAAWAENRRSDIIYAGE
jgi:peptidoglycan-associated lipoprotein